MKNLKKLLAVIVTVCLIATFAVPAFAAEAKSDADVCKDLGMVLGTGGGVTDDYLASLPTRYQGAILFLRLLGLEDEAKAFIPLDNFSDLDGVNETNKAIIGFLKANPDLGFEGVGNNMFDPLSPMTAKQYYKVILVALGYEYGVDFTWANVFQFAAAKGIYKLVDNETFTIEDLCTATVEALKATVKGGTDTLLAKLVESGAIAADKAEATGFFTLVPKDLEVVSATADNFKVAKVVFNKELDKETVKKANFDISGIDDVKLLDDNKTVAVILTTGKVAKQNEKLDITIKDVKSADGVKIAETKKTIEFIDTTIPSITGAVAKNAKTIIVSATEPIDANSGDLYQLMDDIKIDDTAIIAKSSADAVKNTVTFILNATLDKGSHTISIGNLKDYAGYVAVTRSYNIDVAEDTAAPTIVSAKMNSNTEIEVTFDEDLDENGSFEVNNNAVTIKEVKGAAVTLTLGTALDIGATVEIRVAYKGQKDVMGNEVKEWTSFTFKVADDTAIPTVTAKVESNNGVTLTFNKAMTKDAGKITILDKDDKVTGEFPDLSGKWDTDSSTVLKLSAGDLGFTQADVKDFKVVIEDMKDASIRMNKLPKTTLTLKTVDTNPPTVAEYYTVKEGTDTDRKDDTITFYFSEPIDASTAKNLSNYIVTTTAGVYASKTALAAYPNVSFKEISSDGKKVTLKAQKVYAAAGDGDGLGIQVIAIKDVAGIMMEFGVDKGLVGNYAAGTPSVNSAKATEKKKIEVEFLKEISQVSVGAFVVKEGDNAKANVVKTEIKSDKKTAVLTLGTDIGAAPSGLNLVVVNPSLIKDVYGVAMAEAAKGDATVIADAIAPTITVEAGSKSIVLKFSETVKTTAVADFLAELKLIDKDGKLVTLAAATDVELKLGDAAGAIGGFDKIVISKINNAAMEAYKTYKVQFFSAEDTKDIANNNVANIVDPVSVTTKN